MRLVALIPGGIGDQVLFFPTLDALKQHYPDAEIDVVVEPRAKAAYRVSKSVSDVLAFDFSDRNSPADWANLLGVLRDRDYEAVVSSGRDWGTKLLLWLTGIPTRVGYAGAGSFFLTDSVPLQADQALTNQYCDLLQGLGIPTTCPELSIRPTKADQDWAEAERKRLGVNGYVLIYSDPSAAGTATGSDIYPLESWRQILEDIQQKQPEMPILVLQTDKNRDFVLGLTQTCPGLKITSPGDLGKLAAIIAGANLMIGTEGDPMILSRAMQVYTLVLVGTANSVQRLPASEKFLSLPSPSGKLSQISPEQVLQKLWGG